MFYVLILGISILCYGVGFYVNIWVGYLWYKCYCWYIGKIIYIYISWVVRVCDWVVGRKDEVESFREKGGGRRGRRWG